MMEELYSMVSCEYWLAGNGGMFAWKHGKRALHAFKRPSSVDKVPSSGQCGKTEERVANSVV